MWSCPRRATSGCIEAESGDGHHSRTHPHVSRPRHSEYGFRPFFLLGAIWAALVVVIWLPLLAGSLSLPTAFSPIEWHVHELVYGYVPAVMAGFLLTAVPNWTGRLPVTGIPLLLLVTLWAAGRRRSFSQAASAWRPRRWSTCSFSPRL